MFVQDNNLKTIAKENECFDGKVRKKYIPAYQRTLYCGYLLANKIATCEAMKPAPPVMRIFIRLSYVCLDK